MVLKLLAGLSAIVFIHELGHFLAAKIFKVRVEKFYLFFDIGGKKIFKVNKNGTEFGIGWLPLGGYVKLSGMVDESFDNKFDAEIQDYEFRGKPAWQKAIIMSAGVILNFILGILLLTGLTINQGYIPNKELVNGIYATQEGRDIGFNTGDKIIKINNKDVSNFSAISSFDYYNNIFQVERNDKIVEIDLSNKISFLDIMTNKYLSSLNFPPILDSIQSGTLAERIHLRKNDLIIKLDTFYIHSIAEFQEKLQSINKTDSIFLEFQREGVNKQVKFCLEDEPYLGVTFLNPVRLQKYSIHEAFLHACKSSYEIVYTNIISLKLMITGNISPKNIAGPIGIAKIYGDDTSIRKFIYITAMLSLLIGFMNILPIPGLDGGHIFILLIEGITRRKLSDKVQNIILTIGFILIICLMLFSVINDIIKLI